MKKYITVLIFVISGLFLSSCKTGSCACPVTYEDTNTVLEPVEKNIKKTSTHDEAFAIEHKIL